MSELKPFDLEKAKAGEPIFYEKALGIRLHFLALNKRGSAVCEDVGGDVYLYHIDALRMLPRKVKRWHVITKQNSQSSEAEAIEVANHFRDYTTAIIEHEWEE